MKERLDNLFSLKATIESEIFQSEIIKPIKAELNKQKNAYDCQSLRELAQVKGKKQGLMFILKTLKDIDNEIKNLRYELESDEK